MKDFPHLRRNNRFACLSSDEGEEYTFSAIMSDAEVATVPVKPRRTPRIVIRRRFGGLYQGHQCKLDPVQLQKLSLTKTRRDDLK